MICLGTWIMRNGSLLHIVQTKDDIPASAKGVINNKEVWLTLDQSELMWDEKGNNTINPQFDLMERIREAKS